MEKEEQFIKRIQELCQNAYQRDIVTFSDFLDLNELHMVNHINYRELGVTLKTCGGYELAERQMAAFIPDALFFQQDYPISCIQIRPAAEKFAESLTHRDYLGAILNLGIERSKIGDILVDGKTAHVFCLSLIHIFSGCAHLYGSAAGRKCGTGSAEKAVLRYDAGVYRHGDHIPCLLYTSRCV